MNQIANFERQDLRIDRRTIAIAPLSHLSYNTHKTVCFPCFPTKNVYVTDRTCFMFVIFYLGLGLRANTNNAVQPGNAVSMCPRFSSPLKQSYHIPSFHHYQSAVSVAKFLASPKQCVHWVSCVHGHTAAGSPATAGFPASSTGYVCTQVILASDLWVRIREIIPKWPNYSGQ